MKARHVDSQEVKIGGWHSTTHQGEKSANAIQITFSKRKDRLGNLREYLEEVLNLFRILLLPAEPAR